MSQVAQAGPFRLFDTDGEAIARIETDGSTLKPFVNAVRQVETECRLHFNTDGLHVSVVDPANVFMIDAHLPAEAFELYELEGEHTVGVNVKSLRHLIRRARKDSNDTLNLRAHERRLYASVERGYDDLEIVTDDAIDCIDPDSVRAEPDVDHLSGLDYTHLDMGVDPFEDVIKHVAATSDHTQFELSEGHLHVSGKTDVMASDARVRDVAPADAEVSALYSNDYLKDILDVTDKSEADWVRLSLGDEIPLRVSFERKREGDVILSGSVWLAPRVESGSEDRV